MFTQLQLPDWSTIVGALAFFVSAGVFVAIVVSTVRMSKTKVEKLENLPWEGDPKP